MIFSQDLVLNDSIIEWNSNHKLVWDDFLGEPDDSIFAYAMTSYKIEVLPSTVIVDENENILDYKKMSAKAYFHKYHSWKIEENSDLLNHEQLHFDIAELFARKIREQFIKLKQKKEAKFSAYLKCYKRLWKECRNYQKKYDAETSHGTKIEVNKKWIVDVEKQLNLLQNYR